MDRPTARQRSTRRQRWADLSPLQLAANVLIRAGLAMVILCLLCRLAPQTVESSIVNTMAIIASVLVVITGVVAIRVDRRREKHADQR